MSNCRCTPHQTSGQNQTRARGPSETEQIGRGKVKHSKCDCGRIREGRCVSVARCPESRGRGAERPMAGQPTTKVPVRKTAEPQSASRPESLREVELRQTETRADQSVTTFRGNRGNATHSPGVSRNEGRFALFSYARNAELCASRGGEKSTSPEHPESTSCAATSGTRHRPNMAPNKTGDGPETSI